VARVIPTHDVTIDLINRGYNVVVGVDEVGRGCLAGPVVAAAVILDQEVPGVGDSKALSRLQRNQVVNDIKRLSKAVGLGWVHAYEIDKHGLSWAVRESGVRALNHLGTTFDAVILDGKHNYLKDHCYAEVLVGADALCVNVAAASIIAKVARDNYMLKMHRLYPEFGFDQHVGYGTANHMSAIKQSISPLHRQSFAPVRLALQSQVL
jgi:ribonuclease HII